MAISVIMPVYNEAENLLRQKVFFTQLFNQTKEIELIIIDGGSTDDSLKIASSFAQVATISPQKGRAQQMNYGASLAQHPILYFVHADVSLNNDVFWYIEKNIAQKPLGGFRYVFDKSSFMLKINEYLTRFKGAWAGGGDQTLFISKNNFQKLNGFDGSLIIMEDFDIVRRAKKNGLQYLIMPHNITVSSRKYSTNSWLRVQIANAIIVIAWKLGASQKWMKQKYKDLLHPY